MIDLSASAAPGWLHGTDTAAATRGLAAEVDVESAARAVTADIVAECWSDQDDPSFHVSLYHSVEANVQGIFDILAGRLEGGIVPLPALEFAELCAHLDIPAAEVEKCYRVGMASLWTRWCDVAWTRASATITFDELIKDPTLAIHAYVDNVLDAVVARHGETLEDLTRTHRDRRRLLLTQILDGSVDTIPEELEQELGYSLGDTHIAVLLETDRMALPKREIAALRSAADARGSMTLQHTPRAWVVWLGRPAPFEAQHLSRLRRVLDEKALKAAVGDPAPGLAGLRQTRDQVFEAARVQAALGADAGTCVWLRDVRLEALLLGDDERAKTFIAAELGSLAAEGESNARLRETLLTWLDTGSHVSAAAILGVHENTVRNRLRAAEDLLGAPLCGRRTELQVALRLQRVHSKRQPDNDGARLPEAA